MTIIDTNILLDYPHIVEEVDNPLILESVLNEIDKFAHSDEKSYRKRASKAIYYIEKNREKITFKSGDFGVADDDIVSYAETHCVNVLTNDRILRIKLLNADVKCSGYTETKQNYNGVTYLIAGIDDEEISKLYGKDFSCPFENHYFVVRNDEQEAICCWEKGKLRWVDRDSLKFNNEYSKKVITPLNTEQVILMDMLKHKDKTILYVGGTYGTGKSFLTTVYAMEQLQKGKIDKIVYVPNNSQTRDTMEIGTMPGDEYDKILPYIGSLIDITSEYTVNQLYSMGQLQLMPISLARGRNLENAIILVNEAQNLTEDHIKLLLGRCAEGSRIIFDGDFKQTDKKVFEDKNGLKLLSRLSESKEYGDLFAMVILNKTERSRTAEAAQFLDEL